MSWGDFMDTVAAGTSNNVFEQITQANYEKYKDKFVDATDELVNSDTFLKLMVAEMTNQDPMEPTSNTEFITQLASFSQLSYMKDSSAYSMANYASSLVGKIATATKPDGQNQITRTGVVESVSKNGSSYRVYIDGEAFDLSKVTKVQENTASAGSGVVSTALGDSIARAAAMVGMYATVKTDSGNISGFIESIKVVDGKITAMISDFDDPDAEAVGYALDDIVELTYAQVVERPDDTDAAAEAAKQGAGADKVLPDEIVSGEPEEDIPDLIEPVGKVE